MKSCQCTYLKLLRVFCHALLHSTRILTHRNIISSPPRKSIPNCITSPSLTGKGLDSTLGWLSLMWLRKVPEELFTSLMYHCPFEHQNSQCLRLTTFDLNPTGAEDGTFGGGLGLASRSEYLPTRITQSSCGSILDVCGNTSDGRAARGSWWGMSLMVGIWSGGCPVRLDGVASDSLRLFVAGPCDVLPDRRLPMILAIPPRAVLTDDWPVTGSSDVDSVSGPCPEGLLEPTSLCSRLLIEIDVGVCCGVDCSSMRVIRPG